MSSRCIALLIILIASPLQAAYSDPILTAKPGLCIIQDKQELNCTMALELKWNASEEADYCLYHSAAPEPLQCWQSARQGQFHAQLSSSEDTSYWLQRPENQQHLAQITVRVLSLAQRHPERRRRRHIWSVL